MPQSSNAGSKKISLALLGAGRMGGAMLKGWVASGLKKRDMAVFEPSPSDDLVKIKGRSSLAINPDLAAFEGRPFDVVVLAVKPQLAVEVLRSHAALIGPKTLLVSIVAGLTLETLASPFEAPRAIVRAMPNTPAAIGAGITAFVVNANVSRAQAKLAEELLAATGKVVALTDEAQMDAVTAVSGSGPAYVFHLTECLAAAAQRAGLPEALAHELARETVIGSGALLREASETPEQLRQNVTSPGGTTAAALDVLMGDIGLRDLMSRAVEAATQRSKHLSRPKED